MKKKRNKDWKALVVTGGGWPGDYDLVRALGHAGIPCAVASSDPDSIAFHSRFVRRTITLPPFEPARHEEIANLLTDLARDVESKPVLVYVGDAELQFAAKFRDCLSRSYRFLLPENEVLEALTSKALFSGFAKRYWIPIPFTVVVTSPDDLAAKAGGIRYPCIVKPAFNQDWLHTRNGPGSSGGYKAGLRRHETAEDLLAFCSTIPDWGSGLVIQDYLEKASTGTISFLGYFDAESRCLGSFVGREVRNYPPVTGDATLSEIMEDRELSARSVDYLRRFGMKGIVKIDYLWDPQAGEYRVLEVEPHYGVWHLLGSYAGMNLAAIACRDQRGEQALPQAGRPKRTTLLYFRPDFKSWWMWYRKDGWPVAAYLRSIARTHCYRIFDLGDVRPFIASVKKLWKKTFARKGRATQWEQHIRVNRGNPVSSGISPRGVLTAGNDFSGVKS